jgi:SAM-dependent methyltransferase
MEHGPHPHTALEPTGPNAEQIRYWNETAGPRWIAQHEMLVSQIRPFGLRAMDRAALSPGHRVLDVGCGCGETALDIARRVGPGGAVTGVDVSAVMLERAREAARAAGASNVSLENADAQTAALPAGAFDALYSRFGVMFFSDPEAAFVNLRRALRPGARLAFACWRAMKENPWMQVPLTALERHVEVQPPSPGAPTPFAFAEAARVRGILERAGFGDLEVEAADELTTLGDGVGLDEATAFLLDFGPVAAPLRDADPALRAAVAREVREALALHHTPGGVRMKAAAWIVSGAAR